ncbi:MAG: hypothetical protein Q7I93_03365, partial [Syntrophales bacterium]|nr:hypothetical protein [Syntrophales bacterium]
MDVTCRRLGKAEAMKLKQYMNHLDHKGAISCGPDKNERFVLCKCATYLNRILEAYPLADRQTIDLLVWILGPEVIEIGNVLLKKMSPKEKEKYASELEENILDPEEAAELICRILRHSDKKVLAAFMTVSRITLERRYKTLAYSGQSGVEKKLDILSKMFCLSDQENVLVEFLYVISALRQGEDYFVDHLRCQDISGRRYLKMILQMTDREMTTALSGTLARIELYEMDKHSFAMKDDFLAFFQKPSNELLAKHYFTRFSRKTIPLENHLIDPKITEHL